MNSPLDLKNQKYPINDLIWNIYALDFLEVLRTQHLTEEFTVDYILNKDYQTTELEQMITIKTVLKCQPHLNNDKLKYLIRIFDKSKRLFPNFEKYALLTDEQLKKRNISLAT
jgi:hypothetical protein